MRTKKDTTNWIRSLCMEDFDDIQNVMSNYRSGLLPQVISEFRDFNPDRDTKASPTLVKDGYEKDNLVGLSHLAMNLAYDETLEKNLLSIAKRMRKILENNGAGK